MAYQVPKTWAHGDNITHTDLNLYRDGQNTTYEITGDDLLLALVSNSNENGPDATPEIDPWEGSNLVFIHRYRWLYFTSSGEINDVDGTEEPVTLTDDDDLDLTLFDLDDVPWLSYGQLYSVNGVAYACEFENA